MKKYILTMVLLFFASTCFAGGMLWQGPRYQGVVASGSITAGNLLADLTSTNAFVAPVGLDLTNYQDGRHMIAVYDSSGYAAIGFISSTAPSGETLGGERVSNGTDWTGGPPPTGWVELDCTSAALADSGPGGAGDTCVEMTATTSTLYQTLFGVTDGLVKTTGYVKSGTAGDQLFFIGYDATGTGNLGTSSAIWTLYAQYRTGANDGYINVIKRGAAGTMLFDTISSKQVTDPASTGARIVSAKGGAVRAWTYQHASFNPNVACTYRILFVGD